MHQGRCGRLALTRSPKDISFIKKYIKENNSLTSLFTPKHFSACMSVFMYSKQKFLIKKGGEIVFGDLQMRIVLCNLIREFT